MKKILVVALVVAIALLGASAAFAAVANSKHDLSSTSSASFHVTTGGLSACQYCHTPHGSNTAMAAAPIWNRTAGTASITLYGVGNKTIAGTTVGQPGAISQACLSCHDGSISVVSTFANGFYTGSAGGNVTAAGLITGLPNIGGDLRNDHPVGMIVSAAQTTATSVAGLDTMANMQAKFFFFDNGAGNVTMECGTCHDPHGFDSMTGNANAPFLRDAKNAICVTCHKNK
jgi:predicted CXXCH cytochrome family protein